MRWIGRGTAVQVFLCMAGLPGCDGRAPTPAPVPATPAAVVAPATMPSRDEQLVRAVAAGYAAWGRYDRDWRWAVAGCALPPPIKSGEVSAAPDGTPHARKLFWVYAKDPTAYEIAGLSRGDESPTAAGAAGVSYGQALVKESYAPVEIGDAEAARTPVGNRARRGGKWYRPGDRGDLFVMVKLVGDGRAARGTDRGWVYGVVTPAGTPDAPPAVRQAGLIRQCAECHERAGDGRLFGVRRAIDVRPPDEPAGGEK